MSSGHIIVLRYPPNGAYYNRLAKVLQRTLHGSSYPARIAPWENVLMRHYSMPHFGSLPGRLMLAVLLILVAPAVFRAVPIQAQAPTYTPVERFSLEGSSLRLMGPARGGRYLGVVGPRSAWLGLETGAAGA